MSRETGRLFFGLALATAGCFAQAVPPAGQQPQSAPPVRVNVLNVCDPPGDEQKEMAAALARVPRTPVFASDFEVDRGRSRAPGAAGAAVSNWVRVRREFGADSPFSSVQYSFSVDPTGMAETLVFRLREAADLLQIALEDKVTSGTPAAALAADTPASRIRVERLGKTPRGLARCSEVDQSAYQPLFTAASGILARYRRALNVRRTVGADLARLGVAGAVAEPPPQKLPKTK